jgi:hypothetical protein
MVLIKAVFHINVRFARAGEAFIVLDARHARVSRFSKPAPPARAKRLQWEPAFKPITTCSETSLNNDVRDHGKGIQRFKGYIEIQLYIDAQFTSQPGGRVGCSHHVMTSSLYVPNCTGNGKMLSILAFIRQEEDNPKIPWMPEVVPRSQKYDIILSRL